MIQKKYFKNLRTDHMWIYSYETKVAMIDHINEEIYPLGYWSPTTSKHINYIAAANEYTVNKEGLHGYKKKLNLVKKCILD